MSSCDVLWLNGPAGTGKTMLVIGIISEISKQPPNLAPGISYFFFLAKEENMDKATGALRSLIWLLLIQQPQLLSHLRDIHKTAGAGFFNNPNAFWPLAQAFKAMLADDRLLSAYLAFDALDECDEEEAGMQDQLVGLISESLEITSKKASGKVKWLLSSRPEIAVYDKLKAKHPGTVVALDIQAQAPVDAYIHYKLSELGQNPSFTEDILKEMSVEIRQRAENTFLWVALVLRDLVRSKVPAYYAVSHIKTRPPSLSNLYNQLMANIENGYMDEPKFCKAVLAATCFAYRPFSFA